MQTIVPYFFLINVLILYQKKLGKVLESCSSWLVDNKLSLHLGKTECMLFGPKRKLSKVENFSIICNEHVIKATHQVKYLGLFIDDKLSGESIVFINCSKSQQQIEIFI